MTVRRDGRKHAAGGVPAPLGGIIFFAFSLTLCEECGGSIHSRHPIFKEEFP
jgi:hypothetical protein